ncbi:DUF4011 domain-containing protein, partial [Staphylococcus condimenti]
NYSLVQNDFPLIKNIQLLNEGEEELRDLKIKIYSLSGSIYEYIKDIPVIEAENELNIADPEVEYNYDYYRNVVERIKTNFFVEIFNDNDETIYKKSFVLNVLPYQHWLGTFIYPQLTCAYIIPNDNKVKEIISKASVKLNEWTADPSFDGYQSESNEKVRLQAAAIYAAIQQENIAYINPPASFERFGQKIRYPEEILQFKNGTCLDLSFLFASCLEAVGIHPLVIITKGHAFTGFWLQDKNFTETYITDYATLYKRLAKGTQELEVFETTAVVNGKNFSFEDAVVIGHRHLIDAFNFEGLVDITSGRQNGIQPVMTSISSSDFIMNDFGEREQTTVAPNQIIEQYQDLEYKVNPLEKTDIWSRNLLDLTLRNPMINFRMNQSSLQLMVYDIASLEDEMASYENFRIIEKPESVKASESVKSIYNSRDLESKFKDMIDADFKENRIRSFVTDYMLEKQLKSIYRKARTNLEENGSNSLFLAIGFLKWCDASSTDKTYRAPIILLPLSIEKKSASNRFTLELSEDEPQLNVTLVEYLYQKFDIDLRYLIDLPKDEKGIDIPLLFSSIRKSIMNKEGWDIEEIAVISNFSFSKFVMWNDLQNRKEEISANKNVDALIKGNYKIDRELESIDARDLEKTKGLNTINTGSTVDASQLEAIKASENSSFVLHGPPGTGKSQTITNMIIHNLSRGKKILFVAEKRAALNVVNDRLSKLGLEDFTLELHSNKTKKTMFLNKLEKSISNEHMTDSTNMEDKSELLYKIKNDLSEYVEELHKIRETGFSLYELIQEFEGYKSIDDQINISNSVVKNLKEKDIDRIKDITRVIDGIAVQLKFPIDKHPLRNLQMEKYSISKKDQYLDLIDEVSTLTHQLEASEYIKNLEDVYEIERIIKVANSYDLKETLNNNFYHLYKNVELSKAFNFAESKLLKYRSIRKYLLNKYDEKVLGVNGRKLKEDYLEVKSKFGLFKQKKLKNVTSYLENLLRDYRELSNEEFEKDVDNIIEYHDMHKNIDDISENLHESFGDSWEGRDTDLEKLSKKVAFAEKHQIYNLSDTDKEKLSTLLKLKLEDFEQFQNLSNNVEKLLADFKILETDFGYNNADLTNQTKLSEFAADLDTTLDGMKDFKNWALLNEKFAQIDNLLETDVKNQYMSVSSNYTLETLILKSLVEKLIRINFASNEVLDSFNGFEIEEKIKILKDKVDEFNKLSIINAKNKVIENLYDKKQDDAYEAEFLTIQKAIRSKGRGQSIRSIFNKTANVIQDIFPVMLMSPLSIAQYIDPQFPKFDLVIFDEASQIPTDIAVGAISRGKQCIVVGDPKQMPPTTFFGSNTLDEDNLDIEDLESLLDDCLAANFPEKHLLYHYRSNHESLIHFSNTAYYDSALKTYPSPDALSSKVSFRNAKGEYRRGSLRNNEKEATEVVKILINHLKQDNDESIGVVTFNIQQQNLIEDMLNAELVKHKELDTKNTNAKEPIFIKNLENVQGDERDIIVFSTTFGPDEKGKMTMNFGPLNNQGGWRRLNVAVTRARNEMIVVTSFDPEDINLARTKADGVMGLKRFLEFARNPEIIPPITKHQTYESDSIVKSIQKHLKEKGYESKINLGNSELKVDIAVQNPNDDKDFILGVLIDGENYFNGKTANDRNIIQPSVLNHLGWDLFRIWSIDWYEDKDLVLDRLDKELDLLMKGNEKAEQTENES